MPLTGKLTLVVTCHWVNIRLLVPSVFIRLAANVGEVGHSTTLLSAAAECFLQSSTLQFWTTYTFMNLSKWTCFHLVFPLAYSSWWCFVFPV